MTTVAARRSKNLKKKTIFLQPSTLMAVMFVCFVFFVLFLSLLSSPFFLFVFVFVFFSFWVGLRFPAPLIIRPLKR